MNISDHVVFSDAPDVEQQAAALGCQIPSEFAILPRNFFEATTKDELSHEQDVTTLRVYFRLAQIRETRLEQDGERIPDIVEHGLVDIVAPTLLFTFAAISQNPDVVAVVLGVVSNYLTDFLKGKTEDKVARLNIVVKTKSQEYRKIVYSGPVHGLDALSSIISNTAYEKREDETETKTETHESA